MTADLQHTFYALENHFSCAISLKCHEFERGDSVAYIAGIDEAKFNVFLQRKPNQKPELLLSNAKEYFEKNNIPGWAYIVPSTLDTSALQSALKHHGLVFDENSTAMHFTLGTPTQNIVEPEISLVIQSADANKTGWLKVLQDAFGGTDLTNAQYAQALDRAKSKVDMQHFLGTLDGEPVAAITLTFLNDSVRIDNVATAHAYHRLGYGSQMVQFVVNLSHAKGFKHCFLDASSNGLSVYQRLGFSEIFSYNNYSYSQPN